MVGKTLFLIFTLVILLHPVLLELFRNVMKPLELKILTNPKRVANLSFSAKIRGRNDYVANAQADLVQPIRNVSVRFQVFRFYSGYRLFVPNITENFCEFMAGRKRGPVLQIVTKLLRRTSNLNHTCPYTKKVIVREFRITPDAFPSLIPQGKYKFEIFIYDDTVVEPYVATVIFGLEVLENVIRKNKKH